MSATQSTACCEVTTPREQRDAALARDSEVIGFADQDESVLTNLAVVYRAKRDSRAFKFSAILIINQARRRKTAACSRQGERLAARAIVTRRAKTGHPALRDLQGAWCAISA